MDQAPLEAKSGNVGGNPGHRQSAKLPKTIQIDIRLFPDVEAGRRGHPRPVQADWCDFFTGRLPVGFGLCSIDRKAFAPVPQATLRLSPRR